MTIQEQLNNKPPDINDYIEKCRVDLLEVNVVLVIDDKKYSGKADYKMFEDCLPNILFHEEHMNSTDDYEDYKKLYERKANLMTRPEKIKKFFGIIESNYTKVLLSTIAHSCSTLQEDMKSWHDWRTSK
jgi:hypothetical protein